MLFFVEAEYNDDEVNLFVRAKGPRQAFEFWRSSGLVKTMTPGYAVFHLPVKVWLVPDVEGPLGEVDWPYGSMWEGREDDEFPEDVGDE